MRNTEKLLDYILGDSFNFKFEDNILILGEKSDKVNIVFSCSSNPSEHVKLFRKLVEDRKPILWVKDNFTDQMFRNKDLLEFIPNFKKVITILSPEPLKEKVNIEVYELPEDLFTIKLFDTDSIQKVINSRDFETLTKTERLKCSNSINNLIDSVLHQDSFNYSNFLLSLETSLG